MAAFPLPVPMTIVLFTIVLLVHPAVVVGAGAAVDDNVADVGAVDTHPAVVLRGAVVDTHVVGETDSDTGADVAGDGSAGVVDVEAVEIDVRAAGARVVAGEFDA